MKKVNQVSDCCAEVNTKRQHCHSGGQSNAIYGLGVIGALFYFLQNTASFTEVIVGIGKSVFWPAILMFELLTYLKM